MLKCGADFRGGTVVVAVCGVGVSEARISIVQLISAIIQFGKSLLSSCQVRAIHFSILHSLSPVTPSSSGH